MQHALRHRRQQYYDAESHGKIGERSSNICIPPRRNGHAGGYSHVTMPCVLLASFTLWCSATGCESEPIPEPSPELQIALDVIANDVRRQQELANAKLTEPVQQVEVTPAFVNSIGMKFVEISGGEFLMGSSESDLNAAPDEKPQHLATIAGPFFMGMYEVTQQEYHTVTGSNPSYFSLEGQGARQLNGAFDLSMPVEQVTWDEANKYCERLSALPEERSARRKYRLPTEAEWEFACRAGSTTVWSFGNDEAEIHRYAWYSDNSNGRTHRVGLKLPNDFGLFDMHGNVWEWCSDPYDEHAYSRGSSDSPPSNDQTSRRVMRGGGWFYGMTNTRSACRDNGVASVRYGLTGLRIVCEIHDKPSD